MSNFVNTIDLYGDQATADAIVSKTITEFRDDVLETISDSRFRYCDKLTTVDLPNATSFGSSVFAECTSLKSINLPKVTQLGTSGNGVFFKCSSLERITMPELVTIPSNAFSNCTNLGIADFAKATSLGNNAFTSCSKLETLILRVSAVCALGGTTPFGSTSVTRTIYVPYDFIDAYKNATNWSSLVANGKVTFEAIEGSEYD